MKKESNAEEAENALLLIGQQVATPLQNRSLVVYELVRKQQCFSSVLLSLY